MSNLLGASALQSYGRQKAERLDINVDLLSVLPEAQLVLLTGSRGAWSGHVHDLNHVFLNICLEGGGEIAADYGATSVRGNLRPGVMGLTPKTDAKGRWPAMRFAILGIHPSIIEQFFASVGQASPTQQDLSSRASTVFRDPLIEQILREMIRRPGDLDCLLGAHGTGMILDRLFRPSGGDAYLQIERSGSGIHPLTPRQLREIDGYIDAHMARKIATDELASIVSVSRFHFSRRFSATTSEPPHRYMTRRKMLFAAELIRRGLPQGGIAEVAVMVGYDNPSSFSRAFIKELGVNPTTWRRMNSDS